MNSPIVNVLALFAAVYFSLCGYLYFSQRSVLFPAPRDARDQSLAQAGEDVHIKTPDGELLYARYAPAPENRPTVLYFHGNGMQVAWEEPRAKKFIEAGYGALIVEYRGYPGSSGAPSEQGLLADGLAAYDWLIARGVQNIVINAHSLGTGIGVYVASQRSVAAVALEASYDSLVAVARDAYPVFPVGLLMKDKFEAERWIRLIDAPLFVAHGAKDDVIALRRGRTLFNKAEEPKTFVVLDNAGHNDLTAHGSTELAIDFFNETVGVQ